MRRDVDAVSIALPDHWHGIVATQAARAKKDIYCEKPLAHNFREGLAMVQESEQQRPHLADRQLAALGARTSARPANWCATAASAKSKPSRSACPRAFTRSRTSPSSKSPPRRQPLFYDRWLGPAAEMPYREACVHVNWRWNLNYGGGQLMDWIGHHVDIAHWGMGWDANGPSRSKAWANIPPRTDPFNTATRYKVHAVYPDGTPMTIAGGYPEIKSGTKWIGERAGSGSTAARSTPTQIAADRANRRQRDASS